MSIVIEQASGGHIAVPAPGSNGVVRAFAAGAKGTHASRKLVSSNGFIVIVEPDDLIRELLAAVDEAIEGQ